jgi:hypothetical protein
MPIFSLLRQHRRTQARLSRTPTTQTILSSSLFSLENDFEMAVGMQNPAAQ